MTTHPLGIAGHLPPEQDGCDESPSCLTCPLERCKFEVNKPRQRGAIARAEKYKKRDAEIRSLVKQGLPVEVAAVRYRLSKRSVLDIILKKGK